MRLSLFQYLPKRSFSFTYPCSRKLKEVVKMSLFEKETPVNIEKLWKEYHNINQHTISKVLPTNLYLQLLQK
jgi:ATP synthase F1 complex assembly factor 1